MGNQLYILDLRYSEEGAMPQHIGFFEESEVRRRVKSEGLDLAVRTVNGAVCFVVTSRHEKNVFLDQVLPACKVGR